MHLKLLVAGAFAGVCLLAPAAADASCCGQEGHAAQHAKTACCDMPCCKDNSSIEPSIVERFMTTDPQLNPAPPIRQVAEVWFHRPVLVGKSILQGRYVIEHDNDRMARGEPCTHIYAFEDQKTPIVAFHCTHLERDRAKVNVVVLTTTSDGNMQKLSEFQFAGETASHGYPTVR